ncbi:MAG: CHASE2 domain-containing protein [Dictyoglomaceae bacterium]|nr:CHASE2 domain-containing protein [Dictyoglomaceae bacterium]
MRRIKNKILLKFLILLGFFLFIIIINLFDIFTLLEDRSIDWRFHIRGERSAPDDIVIIGIDDESLLEIGNWPWSRSIHGKLLDILKEQKPKLIIFDIIFDIKTKDDQIFAEKIKTLKNVILSSYLSSSADPKFNVVIFQLRESVPVLKKSAIYNGISNLILDKDKVVRKGKLYFEDLNKNKYHSLALYAYSFLKKVPISIILKTFPSEFYINFSGGPFNIKILSYNSVIKKETDISILKNKIVFIGAVSELLKDSYLVPFTGYKRWGRISLANMPGVEIHANILSNLLRKNYLTYFPSWFSLFISFFILIITGFIQGKKILINLLITLLIISIYSFISLYFFNNNIIVPFIIPIFSIVLGFIGNIVYQNILPRESLEGLIIKGRYKIIKKLGAGGMATVYLAMDLSTKNNVAVKILHPQYSEDPQTVERFLREAKASTILDHPNIVKVLDQGKEENYYYIVMEYVLGKDLKKIIEEKGSLPPFYAKEIIVEVAKALDHANSKNIIHRDIKPQNIMITFDGKVKLMDFGIAHLGNLSTITQTGIFMGTPQYASPEQAEGSKVDIRSDIYSLGVVFFELLTGFLPYSEDTTITVMFKKLQEELPDPKSIKPEIPEGLSQIVKKMTARFPEDRYQNPKELIEDLERGYPLKLYEKRNLSSQETIIKPKEE